MKAKAKQAFEPLDLTIKFETLEELQAFEIIFRTEGIVSADFIEKHLDTDAITNALPPDAFTDEQFLDFVKDLEAWF